MAEQDQADKTLDPTQKKLEDAHKKGDVAKSQEVNTFFVLMAATLLLTLMSGAVAYGIATTLKGVIANAHQIRTDGPGFALFTWQLSAEVFKSVALPLLLLALAAIAGNMIQHKMVWSTEPITPKLSKISPLAGFKRLFGKTAWVQFFKGILKIALIGAVMTALIYPRRAELEGLVATDILAVLHITWEIAWKLLAVVMAILLVIAAADYAYQYYEWYERQRMSMQEMKDEFKQTEGDPQIKAKIRQLRQARAKQRMMAQVPNATVVITNPTHYAVALKYEPGMEAPICLAKGLDAVALKIREVAGAHDVPIIENPPLARALHATVDLDEAIPAEHYKAVAEVIGFVMKLRRGGLR
jgi:flagellar biosynthetic protein FlhB